MGYLMFAFVIGLGVPIQTAVNSRLRSYVLSPYVASMVSFSVGTLFLLMLTLLTQHTVMIPSTTFTSNPWWIWIGGLLGVIGLTTNILLFPKLGGVQTVILPIMGQILMGMLIDSFGLFQSPTHPFNIFRLIGMMFLLIGVYAIVVLPHLRDRFSKPADGPLLPWQVLGIVAGMLMATQSSINGHLGKLLHSSIHAAFVSFLVGTIILVIIVCSMRKLGNIRFALGNTPWWIWMGGIIGSFFVFGMSFLVPIIGTGMVVVMGLFGQIICSIFIDRFGLLGATKTDIKRIQVVGIILMLCGVIMIKMF